MDFKNPLKGMSKTARYATIFGSLGVGGYMVYRHHSSTGSWNPFSKAAASTTSTGSATSIDPITGLAYSDDNAIDPITGQAYLAEATQYGSVAAAEASVTAYGQSTATGSGIGVNPASPQSTGTLNTPVGSNVYTSNAAWAQAVTAGLTDVGYDGPTVSEALGAYETGTPVTAAQAKIINTAIAEYGPAPVGNLQVILAPTTTPSPTTNMVDVPNLIGMAYENVAAAVTAKGLKFTGGQANKTGSIRYVITQTPVAGTSVNTGSTVTITTKYGTSTTPKPTPVFPPKPTPVTDPIFNATYTVKAGETLAKLAARYKITVEQLAHANGLGTGAGLRTGQTLKVPSPAPGGTPNPAK
jgi:LysM repeat protein